MADERADPLSPVEAPLSPVAESVVRLIACALLALFAVLTGLFVAHHRSRLAALCGVRCLLSFAVLLWVSSALIARRSFWDVVLVELGVPALPLATPELLCAVHAVLEFGIFEPLTLGLIGLVFHVKSHAPAAAPWRAWRRSTRGCALTGLRACTSSSSRASGTRPR